MKYYVKRLILATDISKQEEYLEQLEVCLIFVIATYSLFKNLTERRYLNEDYLPTHEDVTLVMEVATLFIIADRYLYHRS